MNVELEKQLVAKYPKLLADYKTLTKEGYESAMYNGIQCEDGWYNLIDECLQFITDATDDRDDIKISQIKEKFAGLRIYFATPIGSGFNLDAFYRLKKKSFSICEKCGSEDSVEVTTTSRYGDMGGLQTLCGACKEKHERYTYNDSNFVINQL